jgi:hypothetical protein
MRDPENMVGTILVMNILRGLFIAGFLLSVVFGGDPSLLEAIVSFIGRH